MNSTFSMILMSCYQEMYCYVVLIILTKDRLKSELHHVYYNKIHYTILFPPH